MSKKCINCKHLIKGRYYAYCELFVPRARIEKKQLYQFVRCKTFREKDYTGIPDSLWKLGPTEAKTKKKVRDLSLDEFMTLCKKQEHQCEKCPCFNQGCGVQVYIKTQVLDNEVEIDE